MNAQLNFELSGSSLERGSSYDAATDGKFDLGKCAQSYAWDQGGGQTVWLKIDLQRSYFVTNVTVLTPKSQSHKIYVSNNSGFLLRTRCNQSSSRYYDFHCLGSQQVRYITVVYENRPRLGRMKVCEVEVFYKPGPRLPCPHLPHLPNSTTITDWKTATYSCINNLVPETQTIACLPSGQWSRTLKQCRRKCSANEILMISLIYCYL